MDITPSTMIMMMKLNVKLKLITTVGGTIPTGGPGHPSVHIGFSCPGQEFTFFVHFIV